MKLFISGLSGNGGQVQPVYGCTDPLALNYNPLATVSDGSCIYSPELSAEENIMIIGTSNAKNTNTMETTTAIYTDLPTNGFIENAFYCPAAQTQNSLQPFKLFINLQDNITGNYGYEYRIAKNLIGTKTNRVNIMKCGVGSSGLSMGFWQPDLPDNYYGYDTMRRAQAYQLIKKTWTKCIVIGWENDCINEAYALAIKQKFQTLIAAMRSDFNNPNLHFYVLRMGPFTGGGAPYFSIGRQQMEEVANEDALVTMFEPNWLSPASENFNDGLHYNVQATNMIALKFIEVAYP